MQYRQGDVFIEQAEIPTAAKIVRSKQRRLVLAEGEVTGHAHAIVLDHMPVGATAKMLRDANREFLRIEGAAVVVEHEEHAPVVLAPGDYGIIHQREYTPEEIRRVAD
jgi:hypothetical protein